MSSQFIVKCFFVKIIRMTSSYNFKRSLDNIGLEKIFFKVKKINLYFFNPKIQNY